MNGKNKLVTTGFSLSFIVILAIGYGGVKSNVTHNIEEIKEVKAEVVKNVEDIDVNENVAIEQSVLLEQMQTNQLQIIEEFKELQRMK